MLGVHGERGVSFGLPELLPERLLRPQQQLLHLHELVLVCRHLPVPAPLPGLSHRVLPLLLHVHVLRGLLRLPVDEPLLGSRVFAVVDVLIVSMLCVAGAVLSFGST